MNRATLESVLRRVTTDELAAVFTDPIAETAERFDITTQVRIACFVAQAAHESARFTRLQESLNYSASRLLAVFPSRVSLAQARQVERNPQAIGNLVYGGREGNALDEGYKYRGRGLFQLTFANNYRVISDVLGMPELMRDPDIVSRQPRVAALTAGAFWSVNRLNEPADRGDFKGVTRRINRGLLGYEERLKLYEAVLPECGKLFKPI